MSKQKSRAFTEDLVAAMIADINMALAGVAMKYKVDLILDDKVDIKGHQIKLPLSATLVQSTSPASAPTTEDNVSDRIAVMIAALPSAQVKHFPKLPLTSFYRNGDHTYKILGFNSKAREHKLLMQNVDTAELFRFSIEQVSEFKVIKPKRAKK